METKNDNSGNNNEPKKSWFERNLWLIAVGIAIFFLRMCRELS